MKLTVIHKLGIGVAALSALMLCAMAVLMKELPLIDRAALVVVAFAFPAIFVGVARVSVVLSPKLDAVLRRAGVPAADARSESFLERAAARAQRSSDELIERSR
jgi:hypothetical protein